MSEPERPLPQPTPETEFFWDGCKQGELRLQQCNSCQHIYFPPRPFCPSCSGREVAVIVASGKATLASYVINHRPHPAWHSAHSIAIVALAEGPSMATNIVDCEQTPEALQLDMALQVKFTSVSDEISLPLFSPVGKDAPASKDAS